MFSDEVSIADKERLLCPGKLYQFGTEFLTASTGSTDETSLAGHPQRVEFTVRELGPVAGPSVLVSKEDSIRMLHYRLPFIRYFPPNIFLVAV